MTYIRNNKIVFMCGQTVCYTLESCYNSLPQIPLFLYVFYPPIAECIQEKYWVWWERLWAVLSSTGNRFFSRAVCNHGAVLFPMIARPLAKCANTHTHAHTHTHTHRCAHGITVWKCDFKTSTKYSEGRSECRDITHPSPGDITIFVHHSALLYGPTVVAHALWIS